MNAKLITTPANAKASKTFFQLKEIIPHDQMSSLGNGVYIARKGFFYSGGKNSEDYAKRIMEVCPEAHVTESGTVDRPFRGGASIQKSTHWWVRFEIVAPKIAEPIAEPVKSFRFDLVIRDQEKSAKLANFLNDWQTGDRVSRERSITLVAILMLCSRDEATTILHFVSDFFNVKEVI